MAHQRVVGVIAVSTVTPEWLPPSFYVLCGKVMRRSTAWKRGSERKDPGSIHLQKAEPLVVLFTSLL